MVAVLMPASPSATRTVRPDAVETSVRIVTINTWRGDGAYRARMRALVEGLEAQPADVIACQEALVACDGSIDTPEVLAESLGMHCLATRIRPKMRLVEGRVTPSWCGPALLSKWPIVGAAELPFPWSPADGQRVALLAAIDTPLGILRIANLHLSDPMPDPNLRLRQIEKVLSEPWMRGVAAARVICGDFNATPESPVVARAVAGADGWHGIDAYWAGAGQSPRFTVTPDNPNLDSRVVPACVDYIFGLAAKSEPEPTFRNSEIVLNCPSSEGVVPSAHYGVATTLMISNRS